MDEEISSKQVPLNKMFEERLGEVVRHPLFWDAIWQTTRLYHENAVAQRGDRKHLINFRSILFETYLFYLHFELELYGRGSGANFAEIHSFSTRTGIFGGRTVSDILKRMIEKGQLERVASLKDLRVRRLIPTDAFIDAQWSLSKCYFKGMGLLGIGAPYLARVQEHRDSFIRFRHQLGKAYGEGFDPVRPFASPTPYLSNRNRGCGIMAYVFAKKIEESGTVVADDTLVLNLSHCSEVLEVSRAHIRNVLTGLAERGLVSYEQKTSRVTLHQGIIESHAYAAACIYILYDRSFKKAFSMPETGSKLDAASRAYVERSAHA